MFALAVALAATVLLTGPSHAQDGNDTHKYTVWSSVIFARTGERTPEILGDTVLTSLGAQQQYNSGTFFRQRYLSSLGSANGIDSAPIQGMSALELDNNQLYVMALDQQYNIASAQAFIQGLFPPHSLSGNDSEVLSSLDPSGVLANNTYIEAPMNGYQYAQIHTADAWDIEYPFLGAQIGCPAWSIAATDYSTTPEFLQTEAVSKSVYSSVGPVLLSDVIAEDAWDYLNAYAIYDYVSYLDTHNTTAASLLSDPRLINSATNVSYLDSLRWYADQQQWAWLGNMYAHNNITDDGLPGGIEGSISTLPGNMLAAKLLSQLQANVAQRGEYYKLNLLFGDYQPLTSLFALLQLPTLNDHFYGLPDFGSVATLELFSYTSEATGTGYPSEDDLWVRFWFRNGTDADAEFLAYSLFNYGPSNMDIPWVTFQEEMYKILISDVGDWCTQCGAELLFCSAWNSSTAAASSSGSGRSSHGVSAPVAGVIGAIVTLVIAGLIFALAMLVGGVRVHRVQKSHKGDMGGFKGGQKMRSDQDLTIPKGGAVVGATVESPGSPAGGHERVGSWELKGNEAGLPNIGAGTGGQTPRRPSFEDDDVAADPFRDPVKADERV